MDSSSKILLKLSEEKISKYKEDMKNLQEISKKIKNFICNEYEEIFPEILIMPKKQFLTNLKKGVFSNLEDLYTDIIKQDSKFQALFNDNLKYIEEKYELNYNLLKNEWANYNKNKNEVNYLSKYRKHCFYDSEYASHNCSNKETKFILISNNININEFVICTNCQKTYKSSFILCKCYHCDEEYYSQTLRKNENIELFQATWKDYHCPQMINKKMSCIKCKSPFYLNMKTGMLNCTNTNCKFVSKPKRILWTCNNCQVEFTSEAKVYNPLDIEIINKAIKQTLLLKHRAHPNKMPCCKLNIFFTEFYHKKSCKGILYLGEINDKLIIVCEKCHAINYYERFIWTCPKCQTKFRTKNKDNSLNNTLNSTINNNNIKKNEPNNKNNNENKKEKENNINTNNYIENKIAEDNKNLIGKKIDKDNKNHIESIIIKDKNENVKKLEEKDKTEKVKIEEKINNDDNENINKNKDKKNEDDLNEENKKQDIKNENNNNKDKEDDVVTIIRKNSLKAVVDSPIKKANSLYKNRNYYQSFRYRRHNRLKTDKVKSLNITTIEDNSNSKLFFNQYKTINDTSNQNLNIEHNINQNKEENNGQIKEENNEQNKEENNDKSTEQINEQNNEPKEKRYFKTNIKLNKYNSNTSNPNSYKSKHNNIEINKFKSPENNYDNKTKSIYNNNNINNNINILENKNENNKNSNNNINNDKDKDKENISKYSQRLFKQKTSDGKNFVSKRRSVYLHYRELRLQNGDKFNNNNNNKTNEEEKKKKYIKTEIDKNKEERNIEKKKEEKKDIEKEKEKEKESLKESPKKTHENNKINEKNKKRGAFSKFLFLGSSKNPFQNNKDKSKFIGRNNYRRSSMQNPYMNSKIKERISGKKESPLNTSSSSSSSSSFSDKMNKIDNNNLKDKKFKKECKEENKEENNIEIENENDDNNKEILYSKKSTKVNSKEKEENNKIENINNEEKENLEEKEEDGEDTEGKEVENRNKSPELGEGEEADNTIDSNSNINKIPGISDHLFSHISKRINHILSSSKIKQFNLEDYSFSRRLGEGSYGVIHCLIHEKTKEKFALKKIIAYSLKKIQEFTKEFELVHICHHPNILKIYGLNINILDQTTYSLQVLMEKAERDWDKDIKRRLQERRYYTEEELISIMRQLTSALLFMKEKLNITHRDIKPQNVLIFEGGIYKLADFGEAKEIKLKKNLNTLRGTELYMSPALYNGLKINKDDVDHDPFKSDLFSLGFCLVYAATMNFNLLYELRNINNDEMIKRKIKEYLKDNYSEKFIQIIYKMVELDEKKRFDFKELSIEIEKNYGK